LKATAPIKDAYGRCNRLSPGETLYADDLARGLDELNIIVDELSVKTRFLYKAVFTSAAQTGNITLAAGSWAALPSGIEIFNAYCDNAPLDYVTPERFATIRLPATNGIPRLWTYDGFSGVSLCPQPTGQTIKLETRSGVTSFADLTTEYVVPPGYQAYLGARLAIKLHPVIAKLSELDVRRLEREERRAETAIQEVVPAIIDATNYTSSGVRQTISDPYGWL
jgi:hypothetical protein